jgi:hypothetical protein
MSLTAGCLTGSFVLVPYLACQCLDYCRKIIAVCPYLFITRGLYNQIAGDNTWYPFLNLPYFIKAGV